MPLCYSNFKSFRNKISRIFLFEQLLFNKVGKLTCKGQEELLFSKFDFTTSTTKAVKSTLLNKRCSNQKIKATFTAKNLISYLYKVILTLVQSDLFLVLKCKSYKAKIPSPVNNQ